jgi:large subunit ribosomal protein L35Ae
MWDGRLIWIPGFQARHLSYQRGKRNTNPSTSLVQIEGVADSKEATFYCGKRVAFVYRAKTEKQGSKIRVRFQRVRGGGGIEGGTSG